MTIFEIKRHEPNFILLLQSIHIYSEIHKIEFFTSQKKITISQLTMKRIPTIIIMLRYEQVLKELIDVVNKKNLRKLLLEDGIFTEDASGNLFDADGYEVVCFVGN